MAAGTGRIDYLDGIRAVAIGAVLSLHWLSWYTPLFHGGSIGVDIFFVLSGFIITSMLWRSRDPLSARAWWQFVVRRARRLYPALLGLVVGSVVLYSLTPWAGLGPGEVGRRGLLALSQVSSFWAAEQSGSFWLDGLHPFGQTWSLAIEWYFYLLWPLAVLGAKSRGLGARQVATLSVVAAVLLYALSLPLDDFWFYFGPTARFAEILAGAALALWWQDRDSPALPWRHAGAASAAALGVVCALTLFAPAAHNPLYRYAEIPLVVLATLVLIHVGQLHPRSPVHRLLSHPWVATVGRYSYSLYLWHLVPMLLLEDAPLPLPKPVLGLVAVACAVALTVASYQLLERPFLRSRSSALSRGRAAVPAR